MELQTIHLLGGKKPKSYAPNTDVKEEEVNQFYKELQHLLALTRKRCPSYYRGFGMLKKEVKR